MAADRPDEPDVPQATRGDWRVARVGRIIRKLSPDKLPQLFNVPRGGDHGTSI